ncbi:transcription-repair coupling factor [Solemya pervernicosa gill symbiont]|uniref:Transcription-repair-coupling factor n=2 Tax=Gammaproteobacteria incertae sedis TaxID=118884 RepID=A0A1T2LAF2_9GAMM|nr:transcription-repair coupling factor [Candidatus Reidiella endopervernicosa]OOZ42050.1 transcription-repair coupling factor [Solemya pervernicosa gill symbiont]QKQ27001.1 transcription-repair coupling factor [Candidatus Reidiella endopervernicosa]
MSNKLTTPLLNTSLPTQNGTVLWGQLYGAGRALAIAEAAQHHQGPVVVVTGDMQSATALESELEFFTRGSDLPIMSFPDWETLPYDHFSPHQDIVSQRLITLYRLPQLQRGILILPVPTLMQRLAPRSYLEANTLMLKVGDRLDPEQMRLRLEAGGYNHTAQVMEHGEYTVRGSLFDLYPMGNSLPFRIDLFDDEIESIRTFDPETQRSVEQVSEIRLLPAREFPLTEDAIKRFRQAFRSRFEGDAKKSPIYNSVSEAQAPGGIEYYLPLFFEQTATLSDYLPDSTALFTLSDVEAGIEAFWNEVEERYEQLRHDQERPLLAPDALFLNAAQLDLISERFPHVSLQSFELEPSIKGGINFQTARPPSLTIRVRDAEPTQALDRFLTDFKGRILFVAESAGRREVLLEQLRAASHYPSSFESWHDFIAADTRLAITAAPIDEGLLIESPQLAIVTEAQLYGERLQQRRRRRAVSRDNEAIISNLTDLNVGAPVVHEEHGVGRFIGMQTLTVGDMESEFLTLEYSGDDKLYVPVASLHLISRYSGTSPESAPLHKLGSEQWSRAKRKAAERVRDVAAELLDVYARRAALQGKAIRVNSEEYAAFSASFPFEETPDQLQAIDQVLEDMCSVQPMDRVVCGDVGFGKTEVAMRAAFLAMNDNKQVVMLVPTTLLAQQHYQNFIDRFADWPFRIEVLSRFKTAKQQDEVLEKLADGKVDLVIGTHKLLQKGIAYNDLGLVIVDEEHRFGVRQKEQLKQLRTEVDILTLTATPIPRTLNMSLVGLRGFSIIATPPQQRLAVKTFVSDWNGPLIREACLRELKRGGQIYFLHNEVESIEKMAAKLGELVPEARIHVAHGQMRERELEQIMLDFYHRRCNLLLATTIIESGIDVPNANTIIINRADKLGLAQLHQLRGRVGRSHHRAYAYLMVPSKKTITPDAVKRLEAIESLEDLGAGFMLATHDLEIRGAGELLGDDQSGQIAEIGFSLYTELLERAVKALKAGKQPELDQPLDHGPEVDLHIPALIPDDYLHDVHTRLVLYKRIASAESGDALRELQVEMIDRFGLLPDPVKNLFRITGLKLLAQPLGIAKIDVGPSGGRVQFNEQPNIDPIKIITLVQSEPQRYKLDGQDKLRFFDEMEAPEHRLESTETLLNALQPEEIM